MIDDVFTRRSVSEEDYEILGLRSSATMDEVTNRYHVLSKKNHPDAEDGSSFIFKQIVAAYERIRADRVGSKQHAPVHPDGANGRSRSRPTRQSAERGHPAPGPPASSGRWAWCANRVSQWRWAWVTAVVLLLLAVIGSVSFTGSAGPNDGMAVTTTAPGATPRSAAVATKAIETPSRPSAAPPVAPAPPATTLPPPVACPTGTLTASGGVSVVTDSITSGQWEAVVSGRATNDMSAPILIVSTEVQLEDQSGTLLEPPMAAGGGGTTLGSGQSISIDDNQVQTVVSSGLPRVVSTLINWEWPANSPFDSCPHDTLAVPNLG